MKRSEWFLALAAWTVAVLLIACGGGGGGGGGGDANLNPPTNAPATVTSLTDSLTDGEKALLTDQELQEADTLPGAELNQRGLNQWTNQEVHKAKVYFKLAVHYFETGTSNDADTARFFYGLLQVMALAFDGGPDAATARAAAAGYGGDLLNLGDLLDAFGYPVGPVGEIEDSRAPENLDVGLCPLPLPNDAPSGAQVQTFLDSVVMTDLQAALDSLDGVSATFNTPWTDPYSGAAVESDYGDVLVVRAAVKSAIGMIMILNAQNLDVDIDIEVNDIGNTIEAFLDDNPDFFTPMTGGSELMLAARNTLLDAAGDMISAMEFIAGETDAQADDWINMSNTDPEEVNLTRDRIAGIGDALRDGATYIIDNDTPEDLSDDFELDPNQFFSGLDFRSFAPAYVGDKPQTFPDPTFGGILLTFKGSEPSVLNEDRDGGGTSDIFEDYPEIHFVLWSTLDNSVHLDWSGTEGALGYGIVRHTAPIELGANDERWVTYSTLDTHFVNPISTPGTYYYRVVAVLSVSDEGEPERYFTSDQVVVEVETVASPEPGTADGGLIVTSPPAPAVPAPPTEEGRNN